jgi:uncharacterized protein YggU (UPF0235/DUF167 family)
MTSKKFKLHDGASGSALAVRVTPRSRRNEIVDVRDDGTVRIRLTVSSEEEESNQALVSFLSEILNVPAESIEVVVGNSGTDKLVSILGMDAPTVQRKVLEQMS